MVYPAINNNNVSTPAAAPANPANIDELQAMKNYSLMGQAMVTMESIMLLFTELSNAKFDQMTKKTEVSRDAQDMANRVDKALAEIKDAKDTKALPQDVIDYMKKNNILVENKTINDFLGGKDNKQLDKGDLTAVKSALESASGRASDFVQQNQLKLQQLMQNFNTAVTMANSIQSMNAESTKSIAQSIR